jgi:hypothetical protein
MEGLMDLAGETAPVAATFDQFWAVYPRKVGKTPAKKAWERATKAMKMNPDDILAGARRYAAMKRGTDAQYVAHASTWLNQQRWLDEDGAASDEVGTAYVQNCEAVEMLDRTKLAHQNRKQILQRTREAMWPSIEEAARRIECKAAELWDCLLPGFDGLEAKAWAVACNQDEMPEHLTISRELWLSARDRLDSRKRSIAIKRLQAA